MCHSGEWQSVCADRWSETAHEASVVCSQLGYPGDPGRAILVKKTNYDFIFHCCLTVMADFGRETVPGLGVDIQCNGTERGLSDCSGLVRNGVQECQQVAGVICQGLYALLVLFFTASKKI